MKFQVFYDPKAEKQLDKLPRSVAVRVIEKMRDVGKTGRGIETLRVGDYRVLIDVTYNPNRIWVRYVDHRSRIYKRF